MEDIKLAIIKKETGYIKIYINNSVSSMFPIEGEISMLEPFYDKIKELQMLEYKIKFR